MPPKRVVELSERRYARPTVTRTFEGRDRFAPAAAWLAKGTQLAALGRTRDGLSASSTSHCPIPAIRRRLARRRPDASIGSATWSPTSIGRHSKRSPKQGEFRILAGGTPVGRLVSTYAEIAGRTKSCALFGSSDHLELAANAASAAERLGLGTARDVVEIQHAD